MASEARNKRCCSSGGGEGVGGGREGDKFGAVHRRRHDWPVACAHAKTDSDTRISAPPARTHGARAAGCVPWGHGGRTARSSWAGPDSDVDPANGPLAMGREAE